MSSHSIGRKSFLLAKKIFPGKVMLKNLIFTLILLSDGLFLWYLRSARLDQSTRQLHNFRKKLYNIYTVYII